jgi:hypothetical protein
MITTTSIFTRPNTNTMMFGSDTAWMSDQALQASYYNHIFTNYVDTGRATRTVTQLDPLNHQVVYVFTTEADFTAYCTDDVIKNLNSARNNFLAATGQTSTHDVQPPTPWP